MRNWPPSRPPYVKYDLKEEAFRNNDVEPIINRFYLERASVDPEGNSHTGRDGIRPVMKRSLALS